MFVDASAMVAILTEEPAGPALAKRLAQAAGRATSAIAIWETVIRLMSKSTLSEEEAYAKISQFLALSAIKVAAIGRNEARLATQAFANYGKGRHPAALNMGDCFAYACAKTNEMPLLYIGNDFSQTDVNAGYEGA